MFLSPALSLIRKPFVPTYHQRHYSIQQASIIKFNNMELELNKISNIGCYPANFWWKYPWRLSLNYNEPYTYYQTILIPSGHLLIPYTYPVTEHTQTLQWKYISSDECHKDFQWLNDKLKEFRKLNQ